MSVMIETQNLGRYFGDIKAVDGVSFKVTKGEVLGFLGPNGAGKSTTMKMLTCFLTPSFGTAKVCGFDILEQSRDVRARIGYLPENAPLYGDMRVRDFLTFIAEVRGVSSERRTGAVDRVVQLTGLGDVLLQRIETLSKGFKRRVGLAQALIHDPQVLILDEPTDGLDPNQKHDVRTLIRSMASEKCIVLSTHILEEVDEVCTRVVVIAKGKLVADEVPEELRKRSKAHGAVVVTFPQPLPDGIRAELKRLEGVKDVAEREHPPASVDVTIYPQKGKEILLTVLREAEKQKWRFSNLRKEEGELDEVFRTITR